MGDFAAHLISYPPENEQISQYSDDSFDMEEGMFCNYTSQDNSFYQDVEDGEEEILSDYDFSHWPLLGKDMNCISDIKNEMEPEETEELIDQTSSFTFPYEDAKRMKIDCSSDSKPQTYAAVLQKTLKLKLESSKYDDNVGGSVSKHDAETVLYGCGRENSNFAVVFGDQKYIVEWNLIDLSSQNIPDMLDKEEIEHLSQIYCDFLRQALDTLPAHAQGKEAIDFSSLLMLVASRIEKHEVDGVSQLYYCLNKDWTEEDSSIAHKSYLPNCYYVEPFTRGQRVPDSDDEVLSAKAQAVCTYGFDLNTALTILKDLWGSNKPRMQYTNMFNSTD